MCTERIDGKVISFINMKGGVGKTTLCIGIGEYLAHNHNKKILFIDLDPQFNTTQSLMNEYDLEEEYLNNFNANNHTIKKLFEAPTKIAEKPKLPEPHEVTIQLDDNIDIIPGTIDIIFEDNNRDGAKARRVKKFISEYKLKEKYHYIFIDCPPTISLYTDASLIASDFFIVPNRIDRYSILGIKLLNQVIERISYDEELDIKPLGIVYTMVKEPITQKSQKLKESFEEDEIVDKIGLFDCCTTYVNDLLVGMQGNIASKYKNSCEDISKICDEFLDKIGRGE